MDAVVYGKVAALEKKLNKIITVKHTEQTVSIESPVLVSVPIEPRTSKLMLKTIYVDGPLGAAIDIEIVSSADQNNRFLFYRNSIATEELYDLVDIPYVDEDGTDVLHLILNNKGTTSGAYQIRISGVYAQ
ncbi:hypothetical protein ACPA0F_18145 [Solibacillus silvestris]